MFVEIPHELNDGIELRKGHKVFDAEFEELVELVPETNRVKGAH